MLTLIAAGAVISFLSRQPGAVRRQQRPRRILSARNVTTTGALALLAAALGSSVAPAHAAGGGYSAYQQKVLFEPGQSVLKAESRGRVNIYDGLDESQVDRAMDEQFERIEHMMFVRTRSVAEDGTPAYADDGCD